MEKLAIAFHDGDSAVLCLHFYHIRRKFLFFGRCYWHGKQYLEYDAFKVVFLLLLNALLSCGVGHPFLAKVLDLGDHLFLVLL